MQNAKVVDVTRSFIPVDPNSYPETLHGTEQEDSPEKRVPVIPYKGHNFLPTAHGYKSYFGTNYNLTIDALAPNKPDHAFVFQNLAYKNILIALCDTGIWAKDGSTTGAWTQLVALAAPGATVFYEWYMVTIESKLYVFRANGTAFYEIETDIGQPLGIIVNTITPNFITITAQLGMFKLGARIGFWDAENAIAYCNPDDFTDFTPSVLTGANVTTFNSVVGKISQIRSHGTNAIIYASKSIVGLNLQPGETFFVKAVPILQQSGVPYARQSVASTPDTTHFAYTSTGIYKIENGVPEVIVPEIFDYFKQLTVQPIYMKLMQGRYLAFECMDANTVNGNPQFSIGTIPPQSITFPGYDALASITDPAFDICAISGPYNMGLTAEQQAAAALVTMPFKKPGTYATPIYTAYLSDKGAKNVDNITWQTPCGFTGVNGEIWDMSPVGVPRTTDLTQTSTNKRASYGPDAFIDGKWTIERFIQAQSALWALDQQELDKVNAAVANRAFNNSKILYQGINACVAGDTYNTVNNCAVGRFPTAYSSPQFGFNGCSFWLTRYAISAVDVNAKQTIAGTCATDGTFLYRCSSDPGSGQWLPTPQEAAEQEADRMDIAVPARAPHTVIYFQSSPATPPGAATGGGYTALDGFNWTFSLIDGTNSTDTRSIVQNQNIVKTETRNALNEVTTAVISPTPDTGYCELTHWKYTKTDGTTAIVAANACLNTADSIPGRPDTGARAVPFDAGGDDFIDGDGSVCGVLYESPIDVPVDWPPQTLQLFPAADFLLQDGGIAPKYPTFYGFFCYDMHLKKWGKHKGEYKQLLDYSPINSESSSPVNFANFGILAGVIKADGFIYIFDDQPTDSEITWGKIGYYRQGVTDIQEVRFDFSSFRTGTLRIEMSLDGQKIVDSLTTQTVYSNVKQVIAYPPYSGKWFNITLDGGFDVNFCDIKMLKKGRR